MHFMNKVIKFSFSVTFAEEITHVRQHPGRRMDYVSQVPFPGAIQGSHVTSEMWAEVFNAYPES